LKAVFLTKATLRTIAIRTCDLGDREDLEDLFALKSMFCLLIFIAKISPPENLFKEKLGPNRVELGKFLEAIEKKKIPVRANVYLENNASDQNDDRNEHTK